MASRSASTLSGDLRPYAGLIGKPYALDSDGPHAYDCFGVCVKAIEIFYGYPVLPPRCSRDYAISFCGWEEVPSSPQFPGDLILTWDRGDEHLWFRVSKDKLITSLRTRGTVLVSNRALAGHEMTVYRVRR